MSKHARNITIVLILAGLLVAVPGGGTGARVAIQAVSLAFLLSLGWFASVMYRQHRVELYGLGDSRRATLYVALGVVALALTATSRLWSSASGEIVWFVLVLGAVYAVVAVLVSARRY
jgi:hypothetical protein